MLIKEERGAYNINMKRASLYLYLHVSNINIPGA